MDKNKKFLAIGIYFIVLELLFLTVFISIHKIYPAVFWACNLVPIFLAIGFFTKNTQLVKAAINFEFLPQLAFIILTIIYFTTNVSLIGIKDSYVTILMGVVAFCMHAFSINVALFYTWKTKPEKKSLFYSLIIFLSIYVLNLIFTSPSNNVNFTRSSSNLLGFNIPFMTVLWPILVLIGLVYPTYIFQKFLAKKQR